MLRVVRLLIIAALSSLCLSNAGLAADEGPKSIKSLSSTSVTPAIGAFVFGGSNALNSTAIYGVRVTRDKLGTNIGDSFGVEGTINFFTTTTTSTPEQNADGYLFRLDGIYSIPLRTTKYLPFFVAGLGDMYVSRGSTSENSFLVNYGGGVKYYLEEWLALRADVRHLLVYRDVNTRNVFEFSTGLTYVFGKDHTKKPIPKAPEKKPEVAPVPEVVVPSEPLSPENIDKLGVGGPAVVGIPSAPPLFEAPAAPAPPAVAPPVEGETAAPPAEAPPVPAPVPEAKPAPEPAPAPAPVPAPAPAPQAPAPEQALPPVAVPPAPAPEQPQQAGPRVIYRVTVEFDFDKWAIRPRYHKELATLAQKIKAMPGASVSIEGHTDIIGKESYNNKLSAQRAKSLRDILVKFGVPARKISTKGYGYNKPAAENATEEGRQRNRRATAIAIVLQTAEPPAPKAATTNDGKKPGTKGNGRPTTHNNKAR